MRSTLYLEDFNLAQRCLEGDEKAILALQHVHGAALVSFLVKSGAAPHEAQEVVDSLWADCLAPADKGAARLARYDGTCALRTWLNTVALNRLISQKRDETRWGRMVVSSIDSFEPATALEGRIAEPLLPPGATTTFQLTDAPLLELMRDAVTEALASCSAEEFVLLQLAHCNDMRLADLATMWRCSPSRISRTLNSVSESIARRTMARLRAADGWLEIGWDDFLELCRSANPIHFGPG